MTVQTVHSTEISVIARQSDLPELFARLGERAGAFGMPAEMLPRLELIVEELFLNTILHGYRGDSTATVEIGLDRRDDGWRLRYRDRAPAFDPFDFEPKTASTATIGGLGITLIRGLSRHHRYVRLGDANLIEIDF